MFHRRIYRSICRKIWLTKKEITLFVTNRVKLLWKIINK
nr:MAG TPA: hypothetical protein [Caudoviricetes sp.]